MKPFHLYLYGPDTGPIDSSFEAAAERLETLEMLHFEPDGSFVWVRDSGAQKIYGMLYDAAGRIQYVELQGKCEFPTWQRLITAIAGDSAQDLFVMLLPERHLQDLQSFESTGWSTSDLS